MIRALMIAECPAPLVPTGVCQQSASKTIMDILPAHQLTSRAPAAVNQVSASCKPSFTCRHNPYCELTTDEILAAMIAIHECREEA
jgi:hypothetical protein